MAKKKVTLSVDSDIYDSFRQYCDDNGLVLSKKIDIFMQSEIDNIENAASENIGNNPENEDDDEQ